MHLLPHTPDGVHRDFIFLVTCTPTQVNSVHIIHNICLNRCQCRPLTSVQFTQVKVSFVFCMHPTVPSNEVPDTVPCVATSYLIVFSNAMTSGHCSLVSLRSVIIML
jgi:hypothetical protein